MIFRNVGTGLRLPRPFYAPEGGEGAGDNAALAGDPNPENSGGEPEAGAFVFDAEKAFADLDADTREWLQKGEHGKDVKLLAKKAYEQEKLLGSTIRIPKEDAPPEEREAFLNKLGRPEKADGYQLEAPKDMPEGLPYDGELAASFKAKAHELGLTQAQAAGLHDMFVSYQTGLFSGALEQQTQQLEQRAAAATEALVKQWGPLDGDTAKKNFEVADQVFRHAPGGQEVLEELKGLGLVGPNKEILSAPLATMFAALGNALYVEDGLLRGDTALVDNPFADETSNLTEAMRVAKADPDRARSLIAAAGKKPEAFGLTA